MKFEECYRVGGIVWICEKIGFNEIAEIEGFLVFENAEVVVLFGFEN